MSHDNLTQMLLAEWAKHRDAKPSTYADDYAVNIDHLRIAADTWAQTDAALGLIIGTRLAKEAIEAWEAQP